MIKQLHHACISSSNLARSLAFYRDVLGFKLLFEMDNSGREHETLFGTKPGFHSRVVQFEEGLEVSEFISPAGRKSLHLKPWDIGAVFLIFEVSDLDNLYATLMDKGVKFVNPPMTLKSPLPGGGSLKIAHLHGPDGERISLWEPLK